MHLTPEQIKFISKVSVKAIKEIGYDSCIFGSLACYLWGMRHRTPDDIDIVVLDPSLDLEGLKEKIVRHNTNFYLISSKNPRNSYKVLWYLHEFRSCKVDLLLPGILDIPPIPVGQIVMKEGLPVMPFYPLFYLKVQGWWHHRQAFSRPHLQRKVPQDVRDIEELLRLAKQRNFVFEGNGVQWLPQWFLVRARMHVLEYLNAYPQTRKNWVLNPRASN